MLIELDSVIHGVISCYYRDFEAENKVSNKVYNHVAYKSSLLIGSRKNCN